MVSADVDPYKCLQYFYTICIPIACSGGLTVLILPSQFRDQGTESIMNPLDDIDRSLLAILAEQPRLPIAKLARLASVARGTAQAHIDRMERTGIITGYGPDLDPAAIGYDVLAFVTLEIAQGRDAQVVAHLSTIPEILEVFAVTGPGDLLCRVVARSNDHLDQVLQAMLGAPGINRSATQLALQTRLQRPFVGVAVTPA